jgi:hypothetical protein
MKEIGIEGKYLTYKDKPLVRKGNELYYGDLSDEYYLFMMIMSEKQDSATSEMVPDNVLVQIVSSADKKSILKQKVAKGLREALDIGSAWLERALIS